MTTIRRLACTASATLLALLLAATVITGPAGASSPHPRSAAPTALPQTDPARQGAAWLAGQLTPQGYYPTAPGSGTADLSATAQTVLALSAADVDLAGARTAAAYLAAHLDAYVPDAGADGPAQLALLILDATSLGTDPHAFGGTDLVARLLATQQASGPDAGLFGTEGQVTQYAAGGYQQGLALAALAGAGVRGTPGDRRGGRLAGGRAVPRRRLDGAGQRPERLLGHARRLCRPGHQLHRRGRPGAGRPGCPDARR